MSKSTKTIYEKVLDTMEGMEGKVFRREEIIENVVTKYPGTKEVSIIPSDYCYNIVNNGITFNKDTRLFERLSRGQYKYLGPNNRYNGIVYWKESEYGSWKDGQFQKL